ncbi:MAG TPA: lysophospholipase, partial [Kineobactrum sp.]
MSDSDKPAVSDSDKSVSQALEATLPNGVFYRHWGAVGEPRAVLLLAHGLGEHSGRYQAFAETVCAQGYALVAPDHVGHGRSPGHRAHAVGFNDFLEPLLQLRASIAGWYPGLPCFLAGHSLGGLIAARLLLQAQGQFAGAVLSAAALQVPEPPAPMLLWLNRVLSRLWPTLGLLQLDASQVSRDRTVVAAYEADPLVHHGKVSARLVAEMFAAMAQVNQRCAELTLPLLLLHGESDVMTAPAGSAALCAGAASTDKTLHLYPG